MSRAPRIRRSLTIAASLGALVVSGVFAPSAEGVIRRSERQLIRLVNNFRVNNGESRLDHRANIHRVAERTARRNAESGNPGGHSNLDDIPCSGRKSEVAGSGDGVADAFRNLKNSPPHKAIMLRPYWEKMGVGVASGDDDRTYIVVIFCD